MANNSHIPRKIMLNKSETQALIDLKDDIDEAERVMKSMEESGIDFGDIKIQLMQAKKQRQTLLTVFGYKS